MRSTTDRYGSMAIALHWTSAAGIILLLASGLLIANGVAGADPVVPVLIHASIGTLVLLLTLFRILWWFAFDRRPRPAPGLGTLQRNLSRIVHFGLYVAILLLGFSGIATLALSGAVPTLLAGGPVPEFDGLLPRLTHGLAARLMIGLLVLHIGAALYHHFIRRDGLLSRMGIGQRRTNPTGI